MATTPTPSSSPAPRKTQKKTASRSQAISPIHTKWKSLKIHWAFPGLENMEGFTPFPMVKLTVPSKKQFDAKPYLTKHSFAPGVDLNHPSVLPNDPSLKVDKTKSAYRETFVWNSLDQEVRQSLKQDRNMANATDKTSTQAVQDGKMAQLKAHKVRMTKPAKPVICTMVEQWIVVDVDVNEKLSTPPPIHVWAFLQPHRLDGRKAFLAGDHASVPDDHPRSGWAEYNLNPSGWSFCTTWKNGQSSQDAVSSQDWKWIKLNQPKRGAVETYRYKLRLEVQNVQTAEDLQRKESNPNAASEIESGCWLKVWVRDPLAGFRKSPKDDESDAVMQSMDSQSPRTPRMDVESDSLELGGGPYTLGCHGFLRERMLDAKDWKSSYRECDPVYVLLFNKAAMDDLTSLHQYLKDKGPEAQRIAGSMAAVSVVVLGLAYALRRLRDEWASRVPTPRERSFPNAEQTKTKSRSEQLIKLLESMELPTWLAAYALDGFQDALPNQALATASKNHNDLLVLLSTLYSEVLDFALVDGVKHYADFVKDRVVKRQAVLRGRLKLPPDHKDKAAVAQHRQQMEAGKSRLGLGLAKAAGNLTPDAVSLRVPLLTGTHTTSLPEPFGAPLPIPGIPLLWRVDLSVSGNLSVNLTLTPPAEDGGDWELSFGLSGAGSASAALGIHALWSNSSVASALAPSGKAGDAQTEAEYAANAQALGDLRQDAAKESSSTMKLDVVEKLRSLMKYASLDVLVDAGLTVNAAVGFKVVWNPDKGMLSVALAGDQAFTAGLKAEMAAHLKISLATLDYPLASMDKLATASPHDLTVDLSGKILGYGFPDERPWKMDWGKGYFNSRINKTDPTTTLVWGTTAEFQQAYTEIKDPNLVFDLVRTKVSKPFAMVPKKAVVNSGDESEGKATVQLKISSTANAFNDAVAAGAWSLTTQAKKGALSMDPTLVAGGRIFLQDLMKNGKIDFILHGSYLGSSDSYSDPLTLLAPRLTSLDYSITERFLDVNLTLLNFQDSILWARVAGEDWAQVRLTGSAVTGFHFPMVSRTPGLEKRAANLEISLVPDEIGMLRHLDPSSMV